MEHITTPSLAQDHTTLLHSLRVCWRFLSQDTALSTYRLVGEHFAHLLKPDIDIRIKTHAVRILNRALDLAAHQPPSQELVTWVSQVYSNILPQLGIFWYHQEPEEISNLFDCVAKLATLRYVLQSPDTARTLYMCNNLP
jgi:hypothetical protein